jgi:hypothetical protein
MKAGRYNVEFRTGAGENAELSSGIYFYTLRTQNYSATKKFILMK